MEVDRARALKLCRSHYDHVEMSLHRLDITTSGFGGFLLPVCVCRQEKSAPESLAWLHMKTWIYPSDVLIIFTESVYLSKCGTITSIEAAEATSSRFASYWRVPSQTHSVFPGFTLSRVDDIHSIRLCQKLSPGGGEATCSRTLIIGSTAIRLTSVSSR